MTNDTAHTAQKQDGFLLQVAEFPTDEGDTFAVEAQVAVDPIGGIGRVLVLNGYGIDVDHVPALIEAICTARAMIGDAVEMLGVA